MKYPKRTGIPVRVCIRTCFRGVNHNITASCCINRVLIPVNIVSGIVDTKDFSGVCAVVKNDDGLAIGVQEFMLE